MDGELLSVSLVLLFVGGEEEQLVYELIVESSVHNPVDNLLVISLTVSHKTS